ncbi:MAG: 2-amino-4-hydroxy-6-hydroxymethyldihydropteridine diphosphokinase [Gammaproteobacteria bacterium]|jgi:2-amino-4-hydroxy-6-hydroxymethyldihydropteridine diphosphokinase|nr:2-amino-4-hydroxy-6-hydroxymethyldihydropteridine diphosphokinase [Gammaproteobacteria bacterium]MDH5173244.1 2-amino-4-hydroxy-6-hydroxymethyldihydropteridine diphosphokinase [Gammaproteobacteria bacterium]
MPRVLLGIGSNIERERYITAGLDALAGLFGELDLSCVYDSEAIGFAGQPFLNMVVGIDTDLSPGQLARQLRHIEYEHGRPVAASRFSPRQLDIDILTHGALSGTIEGVELPRPEILENAFVLCPLAEVAGPELHPVVGRTYAELWRAYDRDSQAITRVDFQWRGRWISRA